MKYETEEIAERWETERTNLPMHKDVVDAIDKHLTTLPIVTGKE